MKEHVLSHAPGLKVRNLSLYLHEAKRVLIASPS